MTPAKSPARCDYCDQAQTAIESDDFITDDYTHLSPEEMAHYSCIPEAEYWNVVNELALRISMIVDEVTHEFLSELHDKYPPAEVSTP